MGPLHAFRSKVSGLAHSLSVHREIGASGWNVPKYVSNVPTFHC